MKTDFGHWVDFEIKAGEREKALSDAEKVIDSWGLAMPSETPLTPHFGLGDFYNTGEIEYLIINNEDKGYCGKYIFLFQNQRCPCHRHDTKDETFFIVKGIVSMTADERTFEMKAGDTFRMLAGVKHTFMAAGGPALVLEVSQPSRLDDNFFEDKRIGRNGTI